MNNRPGEGGLQQAWWRSTSHHPLRVPSDRATGVRHHFRRLPFPKQCYKARFNSLLLRPLHRHPCWSLSEDFSEKITLEKCQFGFDSLRLTQVSKQLRKFTMCVLVYQIRRVETTTDLGTATTRPSSTSGSVARTDWVNVNCLFIIPMFLKTSRVRFATVFSHVFLNSKNIDFPTIHSPHEHCNCLTEVKGSAHAVHVNRVPSIQACTQHWAHRQKWQSSCHLGAFSHVAFLLSSDHTLSPPGLCTAKTS